jgi:hypothetical protein
MKGLELLKKYPLSAKVVKDWFMEKMIESLNDDTITKEFREFMLEQSIDDDKLAIMIDANPRMLFDVFDENDIIIYFMIFSSPEGVRFSAAIHTGYNEEVPNPIGKQYNTRKEAELFAIESAFEILEENLSEARMKVIAQNGNTGEHYDEI